MIKKEDEQVYMTTRRDHLKNEVINSKVQVLMVNKEKNFFQTEI